ncbi:MAG: hypothetical protein A2X22_09865 [Bacteroidetes bacterium GWF2_49_14]|nr:MAG: hypothetical protein A2X22_09865 [Bacteroidetes bacterium GWF2_49_14]HBB91367.1 hypothetical protein [Bacteroidales bacterium]
MHFGRNGYIDQFPPNGVGRSLPSSPKKYESEVASLMAAMLKVVKKPGRIGYSVGVSSYSKYGSINSPKINIR